MNYADIYMLLDQAGKEESYQKRLELLYKVKTVLGLILLQSMQDKDSLIMMHKDVKKQSDWIMEAVVLPDYLNAATKDAPHKQVPA